MRFSVYYDQTFTIMINKVYLQFSINFKFTIRGCPLYFMIHYIECVYNKYIAKDSKLGNDSEYTDFVFLCHTRTHPKNRWHLERCWQYISCCRMIFCKRFFWLEDFRKGVKRGQDNFSNPLPFFKFLIVCFLLISIIIAFFCVQNRHKL